MLVLGLLYIFIFFIFFRQVLNFMEGFLNWTVLLILLCVCFVYCSCMYIFMFDLKAHLPLSDSKSNVLYCVVLYCIVLYCV